MTNFHVFLLILYGIDCNVILIMFFVLRYRINKLNNEIKLLKEGVSK